MRILLSKIKTALLTVTNSVRKFDGTGMVCPYIVWSEDGSAGSVHASNRMQEQTATGTIDLYTKLDSDPLFSAIQNALNDAEISFRWESTQYEPLTKIIHHEFVFEVAQGV